MSRSPMARCGRFLTGPLEPTSEAYAIAKICPASELLQGENNRMQTQTRTVLSAHPTDRDSFGSQGARNIRWSAQRPTHVVPSLILRMHEAQGKRGLVASRFGARAIRGANSHSWDDQSPMPACSSCVNTIVRNRSISAQARRWSNLPKSPR